MAPDKKTIWDRISSNGAIIIFLSTVVFNAGKYTGDTSKEIAQVRQEFIDYKELQKYERTQDNLFIIEVRNSINNQNIQISKLIEELKNKQIKK